MNRTGWLALIVCVMLVISLSTTVVARNSNSYTAKVMADSLNVRSEPSLKASIVGKMETGELVSVSKEEHGWLKINSNGISGWVAGYYLKQVAAESGGVVKTASSTGAKTSSSSASSSSQVSVDVDSLRLREGPGTTYSVVTGAVRGDLLTVSESRSGWLRVKTAAGETGWVSGQYVKDTGRTVTSASDSGGKKSGGLKGKVITVDPGHGGNDAGMIGTTFKTEEKDLNLQTSLYLADELRSRGAQVVMTRTKDSEKPSLAGRVSISKSAGTDVFVSIHYNSSPKKTSGTLSFYYSESKDAPLARAVEGELSSQGIGLKSNGISFGDYHVLRENNVPSALIELGFLSNAKDEDLVRTKAYQKKAAKAIAEGLEDYFQR
ncbi:N-acetylmuramoyl-L-alanine amidase [Paenibacillus mendelii]|uniref:N-acetylmuramoyl-L-alanine amidase n=1 Tax=Paenibacillus mendelii TaxID=206163 RepID=A0ABV6J733_9BACL|nr:N-acetylmuramoyl-L-alanine amidase [Paenibacillus mendelii]MCQ6560934.1 N-acetylmuramoyl-L-alanine amidase [Paenibacillus mendelii]